MKLLLSGLFHQTTFLKCFFVLPKKKLVADTFLCYLILEQTIKGIELLPQTLIFYSLFGLQPEDLNDIGLHRYIGIKKSEFVKKKTFY